MNKSEILLKLEEILLENIKKAEEVYRSSHEYTTKGDIKSDGKYDTRATEAGYLAGAQKKRVEELKNDLNRLRALPIKTFSSEQGVAVGALMELECEKRVSHYFISPSLGYFSVARAIESSTSSASAPPFCGSSSLPLLIYT